MLRLSKKQTRADGRSTWLSTRGRVAAAREIAEACDSEAFGKVLQRLARCGVLASQQGTRGGDQLARPAASITVADVIQAIDGPLTVTACSPEQGRCGQFSKCNVRDPLWRIRERIIRALAECSVSEMVAEGAASAPRAAEPAAVAVQP
jgi:Rrf2 family protein